jgi:hypothetical protein
MELTNWNHQFRATSDTIVAPKDKRQLATIVKMLVQEQRYFRVMGKKHSWNEAPYSETIISTSNLTRIIELTDNWIEVEAGVTIKDCQKYLAKHGKSLPTTPSFTGQTLVGACANASHGSGDKCLSAFVMSVGVIDMDGKLTHHRSKEMLKYYRVSLGLLGVIYCIRIAIVPSYRVEISYHVIPLKQWEIQLAHEELDWQEFDSYHIRPYPGDVIVEKCRKVSKKKVYVGDEIKRWFYDIGVRLFLFSSNFIPELHRLSVKGEFTIQRSSIKGLESSIHPHAPLNNMEVQIPISSFPNFWKHLMKLINRYKERKYYIAGIIVRKVLPDDIIASPFRGDTEEWVSVDVTTSSFWAQNDYYLWQGLDDLRQSFNGTLHWGKICPSYPVPLEDLEDFLTQVNQEDIYHILSNGYTSRLLDYERLLYNTPRYHDMEGMTKDQLLSCATPNWIKNLWLRSSQMSYNDGLEQIENLMRGGRYIGRNNMLLFRKFEKIFYNNGKGLDDAGATQGHFRLYPCDSEYASVILDYRHDGAYNSFRNNIIYFGTVDYVRSVIPGVYVGASFKGSLLISYFVLIDPLIEDIKQSWHPSSVIRL